MPFARWPSPRPRTYLLSVAALVAGALLPLSLAPFGIWPLLLVSAGALFWLLRRTPSDKTAFWRGWLFGVGKYGLGASWVYVSINVYGSAPPWLAAILVAGFVAGMALFTGCLGLAFHVLNRWRQSEIPSALGFAVLWTAFEWLLTWFLNGFPWLFAGYAFLDTPLEGFAPLGGVLLVSFLAVLTAVLAVVMPGRRWAAAAIVSVWLAGWGLQSIEWTVRGDAVSVALVQGDVPQSVKWSPKGLDLSRTRYRDLTATANESRIVVWPEAAVPDYLYRSASFIEAQRPASGDIVTGVMVAEPRDDTERFDYYNAAMSTGGGIYRKRRLVPFGDYVPLESFLRGTITFFDLPMSGTSVGAQQQPLLQAAGIDLAMAICWEIAFPRAVAKHARGASALVTISNDTWFGDSIGPSQHFEMARMRALENGKFLVRSTNNGITAIVDDRGDIVDRLPRFTHDVLTGEIDAMTGTTPFARWLNVPLFALLGVCGVAVLAAGRRLLNIHFRRRLDYGGAPSRRIRKR